MGDGFHLLLLILILITIWALYRKVSKRRASRNARRIEPDKEYLVQAPMDEEQGDRRE